MEALRNGCNFHVWIHFILLGTQTWSRHKLHVSKISLREDSSEIGVVMLRIARQSSTHHLPKIELI